MSKVIRAVRITGQVVTLGQAERDLYQDEGQEEGVLDLASLLQTRVEAVQGQLNKEWEARLRQERESLQAAAAKQLEEAEARWQAELEQARQQRFEEGHQAGVAAKEAEAREAVERLDVLHQSLEKERGQILREAEVLVVDLAAALARRVTKIQAETDHRILIQVVRNALEHLSEHSNLLIRVHPEELKIARKFAARWTEKIDRDAVLKVLASEHVSRGGCMIEGGEENIDARLDEQFQVLHEALRAAIGGEEAEDREEVDNAER